jgi:taurine dioxygenase
MNTPSDVTIERLTGNIGAVIGGLDLRQELPVGTVAIVRQVLLDHGVIFVRQQDITMEQYWSFMENFGVPQKEESTGTDKDTAADVMTGDLSRTRYSTATWHADTTSLAKPPIVTALRAVEVPAFGGDTCWSSMYAAWDALTNPIKQMLDGLTAVHCIDLTFNRMRDYGTGFEEAYSARNAREQIHPVVLTHPETGRKALYVSETFTTRIVELAPAESAAVLSFLFQHIGRPDYTMRWKWTPHDLAVWDNRSVQHFAVPDYETTRRMQRIVLAGAKPGEASELAPRAENAA